MAAKNARGTYQPGAKRPDEPQPQRDWERVTAKKPHDPQARTTFRIEGPSPSQEILEKHDAELLDKPEDEQSAEGTICF